jgi:hypothetical protein
VQGNPLLAKQGLRICHKTLELKYHAGEPFATAGGYDLPHIFLTLIMWCRRTLWQSGGYGIQGSAALFVRRLEGDYFNVVGFPLYDFGVHVTRLIQEGVLPLP